MRFKLFIPLIAAFLALTISKAKAVDFPILSERVVDEAVILSGHQRLHLIEKLRTSSHQIVAVSLSSLRGMEIEEYGVALGRHWGIGARGINDGVLVIIAPNDRQMRIEVGYGMEGVLTDYKADQIIRKTMLPLAREGRYAEALVQGTERVFDIVNGNADIPSEEPWDLPDWVIWVLLFGWIPWFIWQFIKLVFSEVSPVVNWIFFIIDLIVYHIVYGFLIWLSWYYVYMGDKDGIYMACVFMGLLACCDYQFYKSWKKNHKYPCDPENDFLPLPICIFGFGLPLNSSSSSSRGCRFHGGGGSFGGGGASGRW